MLWYMSSLYSTNQQYEFGWFFEGYTNQADFENILGPALERGILRSPELVLTGA